MANNFSGKRVLVTGATGFIGGHVARRLLALGAQVRVFARDAAKAAPLVKANAELVFEDVTARKRSELALKESEAQQAFLLKLSDALRAEANADAVANRALRMLADQLGLAIQPRFTRPRTARTSRTSSAARARL